MKDRNVPTETILKVMMVLENAVIDLCQGQFMDISFMERTGISVSEYLEMVKGKTAALFGDEERMGSTGVFRYEGFPVDCVDNPSKGV